MDKDYRNQAIQIIKEDEYTYAYFIDAGAGWGGGYLVYTKAGKSKRRKMKHTTSRTDAEKQIKSFMEQLQTQEAAAQRKVTRTRINDKFELVVFEDDESVELRPLSGKPISFTNEDAYKVYATLQSLLFSNVPYIESFHG